MFMRCRCSLIRYSAMSARQCNYHHRLVLRGRRSHYRMCANMLCAHRLRTKSIAAQQALSLLSSQSYLSWGVIKNRVRMPVCVSVCVCACMRTRVAVAVVVAVGDDDDDNDETVCINMYAKLVFRIIMYPPSSSSSSLFWRAAPKRAVHFL